MISEETPLLQTKGVHLENESSNDVSTREEWASIITLAFPVTLTFFLEYAPGIIFLLLVGHVHDSSMNHKIILDAAAIATMFLNVTGITIGLGLATAMDTLCPQAIGAGQPKRVGIFFQTGLLVLGCILIPIYLINSMCSSILVAIHQPVDVSLLAGEFISILIPSLPFLFLYELMKKVLQAQDILLPIATCAFLCNVIQIVVGYYLTFHTSYHVLGAAYARSLATICLPISLSIYVQFQHRNTIQSCWPGWSLSCALKQVGKFLGLGSSGLCMMLFEWWSFEALILIAGYQLNSIIAIGANAILVNVTSCTYMIYFGIGTAAQIRVGNALGSGNPLQAKKATQCGIYLSLLFGICIGFGLFLTRDTFPWYFTSDSDMAQLTSYVTIAISMYQVADAMNTTTQGILRGCGLQSYGAAFNFVAFIVVGIPLGITFDFLLDWNLNGLWIGMAIGIGTAGVAGNILLLRVNWLELVVQAQKRVATD